MIKIKSKSYGIFIFSIFLLCTVLITGKTGISHDFNTTIHQFKADLPHTSDKLIVTESADPIEVGAIETFTAEIVDPHGVYNVQIYIDGWYCSMDNIEPNFWQLNWTAPAPGIYDYTISYEDDKARVRTYNDSVKVLGDAPPQYSKLKILSNPLELGKNVKISLKVSGVNGVSQVLIEYEGSNHSMNNLGGDNYEYNDWIPATIDDYPIAIHMEDNNHNWNHYTDVLRVVSDASPPQYEIPEDIVINVELGSSFAIYIIVIDASGINRVLIEFEGANHSMGNTPSTQKWCYGEWHPKTTGTYAYTIYMEDILNYWNTTSGILNVLEPSSPGVLDDDDDSSKDKDTNKKDSEFAFPDYLIFIIIIGAVGAIGGIVSVKKLKKDQNKGGRDDDTDFPGKPDKLQKYHEKKEEKDKTPVKVVCPICKANFTIKVPKDVINEAKQLTTVSIPRNMGCKHHFQIFVDKNFIVRGYQKVDYEFDLEETSDVEIYTETGAKIEKTIVNPELKQKVIIVEKADENNNKIDKKSRQKALSFKALLDVKEQLQKDGKNSEPSVEKEESKKSSFDDHEPIYYEIRQFLSIPDENFDLYKVINNVYELDKAKFKILESILNFIQKFTMFKDIAPLMNSIYLYLKQSVELKSRTAKQFEQNLIKNILMGLIKEYLDYTHVEQKQKVLNFLTESLGKLSLEPMIINLGLLLKPMYEDEEYLNALKTTKMEEVSYIEDGDKQKAIKNTMDRWIEEQVLDLANQQQINRNLLEELDKLTTEYNIGKDSELFRTLTVDVKEMLALKLTVLSLMDGISDESCEPVPLK